MTAAPVTEHAVISRLRGSGVEVDASERRTSEYAYDASNYRVRPLAVVFPRTVDDVVATVRACADTRTPVVLSLIHI